MTTVIPPFRQRNLKEVFGGRIRGDLRFTTASNTKIVNTEVLVVSGKATFLGDVIGNFTLNELTISPGSATNPSFQFTNSPNSGIYSPSSNVIGITINGTQTVQFNSSGVLFDVPITSTGNLVLNPGGDIDCSGANLINVGNIPIPGVLPNSVVIGGPTGLISSEPQLSGSRGGTNLDTTGLTGIPHINTGVWSVSPIVSADISQPLTTLSITDLTATTATVGTISGPASLLTVGGQIGQTSGTGPILSTTVVSRISTIDLLQTNLLLFSTTSNSSVAFSAYISVYNSGDSGSIFLQGSTKNIAGVLTSNIISLTITADAGLSNITATLGASGSVLQIRVGGAVATYSGSAVFVST